MTPSYNQGPFLEATIESVLSQNYPELEYFVIDGNSTDDSVSIIKRYSDRLSDWVSEPDRGQSHAINKGFARATGEILGWLNSDDRLEPGALMAVAEEARRLPEVGAFVGEGQIVDAAGKVVYYKRPGDLSFDGMCRWLEGGDFMQPSCFFRRTAWEACGPLDETIHIALDVDLWLRMARAVRFSGMDRLLSTSLRHKDAKTEAYRDEMVADAITVIIRAGGQAAIRRRLVDMVRAASRDERRRQRTRPLRAVLRRGLRLFGAGSDTAPAARFRAAIPHERLTR